jgi:hypothetical protein
MWDYLIYTDYFFWSQKNEILVIVHYYGHKFDLLEFVELIYILL